MGVPEYGETVYQDRLLFYFNFLIFNEFLCFCRGVARMYPGMWISLNIPSPALHAGYHCANSRIQ